MVVTDAKSGEGEASPASGSLWLGKEVTPRRGHGSVSHIVGGASEWTPQPGAFLSSSRQVSSAPPGQGPGPTGPPWGETCPLASPRGPSSRSWLGLVPIGDGLGGGSTAAGGGVHARSPLHT